ncbi:MAG TPA: hypothetical protein DCE41_24810 [Cytophagales bacterium]|nr:hypothetical protein [Cytophagales bacterium]HAA23242.1 hypothetical protein [Cytophagales bacterium]HAP58468.1 hypothetical protein [Cytophagales bacterium]
MQTKWFFFLLLLLPLSVRAQGPAPLAKVKVSRGLQLALPQNMRPMTTEEVRQKYFSSNQPLLSYTTQDNKVDFTIKLSNSSFREGDLPLAGSFYKANLAALYDSVSFIRENMEDINGRQWLVLELLTEVQPEEEQVDLVMGNAETTAVRNYTYIQYTIVQGQLMVCTLTCPRNYRLAWQAAAWDIMHSLNVKKTL